MRIIGLPGSCPCSSGVRRMILAVHRSSNDFISPDTFRKLSFPSLKRMVEGWSRRMDVILHCDGNWDLNLEALRELPAGNVVMQFDGATRHLQGQGGNRRPHLHLRRRPRRPARPGLPSEVDEYCHRLIEEVGKGGGFILGTGCELRAQRQAGERQGDVRIGGQVRLLR